MPGRAKIDRLITTTTTTIATNYYNALSAYACAAAKLRHVESKKNTGGFFFFREIRYTTAGLASMHTCIPFLKRGRKGELGGGDIHSR